MPPALRKTVFFLATCRWGLLAAVLAGMFACQRVPEPKPRGYFRLDLPAHAYDTLRLELPFFMEVPAYAEVRQTEAERVQGGFDVFFPSFGATLYLTYKPVDHNLERLSADMVRAVQFIARQPEHIRPSRLAGLKRGVSGILYEVDGPVASAVQCCLTDSVRHFLRASLYFSQAVNPDSLRPVIQFLTDDIRYMASSLEWKELLGK